MTGRQFAILVTAVATLAPPATAQLGRSIVDTPHNLAASGPGVIRATTEEQVCIFCHTPHNAAPIQPLWNRDLPVTGYIVYSSTALDARPGQPTGASKMCLSCHDGTIALGSVVSRDQIIQMAGGIMTLPPGHSNLGTDLSDDHPISFRYDAALVSRDPKLTDPAALPLALERDHNAELQCTTCHETHDNRFGNFLVTDNSTSTLCRACHQISSTTIETHTQCASCHQPHSAPSGPFLLRRHHVTATCTDCHDGSHPGAADILAVLDGVSSHDTDRPVDPPDPIPGHSTCTDCHDAHTMEAGHADPPAVHPSMGRVSGVTASGTATPVASFEYEVCFKCHGDDNAIRASWVPRVITDVNTRAEFALSAVSFHPVEGPGKNLDVPSLRPGWTTSSIVHCSDCHGSDTSVAAGGTGPSGVHGSNEQPLLLARYDTVDGTAESSQAYALCYGCHERDGAGGILTDASFPHSVHVRDERTPCSACHDAHGISSAQGSRSGNTHLINFDNTIVFPDPVTGRLEFRDTGTFSGNCTLTCHGTRHDRTDYME